MKPIDSATIVRLAYSPFLGTDDEQFGKTRLEKLARLRQIVKNKLKGDPKAERALTMLEQETGAELATIKTYLDTELERDRDFAEELGRLGAEIIKYQAEAPFGDAIREVISRRSVNVDVYESLKELVNATEKTEKNYSSFEKTKDRSTIFKYRAIVKNGELHLSNLGLPEGTEVEAILLVGESEEIDETEYLLSTEANRRHLLNALAEAENPQNYIYVDLDTL